MSETWTEYRVRRKSDGKWLFEGYLAGPQTMWSHTTDVTAARTFDKPPEFTPELFPDHEIVAFEVRELPPQPKGRE